MKQIISIIGLAVFLSSCMSVPKTRDEFVTMAEASSMDVKTVIKINQPISVVNKNLARLSDKCLNKRVSKKAVIKSNAGYEATGITVDYFSTFKVKNKRKDSEFTILSKPQGMFLGSDGKPVFVFAVNAMPLNKTQTQLSMYKSMGYEHFVDIVKNTASGKSRSCPNLTKYH